MASKRVLIVEDEAVLRRIVADAVERALRRLPGVKYIYPCIQAYNRHNGSCI